MEDLNNNTGAHIIYCYGFKTVNDFNKDRWCYRFSGPEYIREAILRTQGFVLNYIEHHPLDCFAGLIVKDAPNGMRLVDGQAKSIILEPIINECLPIIRARRVWVDGELAERRLSSEHISP